MVSDKGEAEALVCEMVRLCERKIVFKPASEEANLVWAWPPGGGGATWVPFGWVCAPQGLQIGTPF